MTISEYISQINTANGVEALSALCVQAKTLQGRDEIKRALSFERIECIVNDPSPKMRKNIYRLIGLLNDDIYLPILRKSLICEKTLFAIPSILLSLGALKDYSTIQQYVPPVSENSTMDKHVAEISLARKKALQTMHKEETTGNCKLDKQSQILCFAPEGFNDILAEELRAIGFAVVTEKDHCRISTSDLSQLFMANCLSEALIPVRNNISLDAETIYKTLTVIPDEPYRIELRGYTKDRRKLITSLTALLPGNNNPSNYSWELRIECREEIADIYWKPCRVADTRYAWRKRVLPASINPALAACLAMFAKKKCNVSNPSVLDPFCGCGSLLFSLEKLLRCRSLMGVDKSSKAIECARENAKAGNSKAFFVTKDILRFESKSGFDIVIANMPFGIRVGNHDNNKELYSKFLRKLPDLLSAKGIAILYTMEYRLLQNCIDHTHDLVVKNKYRTESGGLLPWIFIIDKE